MPVVVQGQFEEQTHSVGAPFIAKRPHMTFRTKYLSKVIFAKSINSSFHLPPFRIEDIRLMNVACVFAWVFRHLSNVSVTSHQNGNTSICSGAIRNVISYLHYNSNCSKIDINFLTIYKQRPLHIYVDKSPVFKYLHSKETLKIFPLYCDLSVCHLMMLLI